jgi:LmbE family N-acetylglucosaminyl deacetylase
MIWILLVLLFWDASAMAQNYSKLRIIAFGAHPDDCDGRAGGVAAKFAAAGHLVKFVAVTNGDAGHFQQGGGVLAQRRRAEAIEAGRRIGVVYEVLDNHDGELMPTLEVRRQIIRLIRQWNADVVMGPRPNDYHPDHRYTGVLVQDAAFMVTVPNVVTDTPALRKNPVFLYFSDNFQRPQPFRPDIVVGIDDVMEKKIGMLDAHVSQVYEWLPWLDGLLDQVPKGTAERKAWLRSQRESRVQADWRPVLQRFYGAAAASVENAEAFEIAEYGRRPEDKEIPKLFPFFPGSR